MRFVFTRRFYILLAAGLVPLGLAWTLPALKYAVIVYDILLIGAAIVDLFISQKLPEEFTISRGGNASTGYQWDILLSPNLVLVSDHYENVSDVPGAGNTKVWIIKPIQCRSNCT